MSSSVDLQLLYKIANAPINPYPFPHLYVRDVFPREFYRDIRANFPPREAFMSLKGLKRVADAYPDSRLVLPLETEKLRNVREPYRSFWARVASWMLGGAFGHAILRMFMQHLHTRFDDPARMQYYDEALLVQDYSTYSLSPHTDTPLKVASFLFYLPQDDSLSHLGTSIYVPRNRAFHCAEGLHHPFEQFDRLVTMPFLPNTLFAFLKTPTSFHGVEPIVEAGVRRDLLLYDIKVQNPPELARAAPARPTTAGAAPAVFSW